MSTYGQKGVEAVKNRSYQQAIELLDKALAESQSPAWLLARSQASNALHQYESSLQDAELAYHIASERGSGSSRDHMIKAQYRRSVALFQLGRYANADCCARWSQLLAEGRPAREQDGVEKQVDEHGFYSVTADQVRAEIAASSKSAEVKSPAAVLAATKDGNQDWNRAAMWRCQVLAKMETLPSDDEGRKVTVTKIPVKPIIKKQDEETAQAKTAGKEKEQSKEAEKKPKVVKPGSIPDDQMVLKIDFYQSSTIVTITLFVKDANKENLKVDIETNQVTIGPIPREVAPYVKPGDRESFSTLELSHEIDVAGSRFTATSKKIELVLKKASPNIKWGTWGKEHIGKLGSLAKLDSSFTSVSQSATQDEATPTLTQSTPQPTTASSKDENPPSQPDSQLGASKSVSSGAPAYPTSSKSGPKNWDKFGAGEEDDDDKKDVNFFFKQLYANSSEEQQRAMMKSFIESNGTALSTDWNDVKNRKVETVPPDGVEAKKW